MTGPAQFGGSDRHTFPAPHRHLRQPPRGYGQRTGVRVTTPAPRGSGRRCTPWATSTSPPKATADGVHYPGTYIAGCHNRLTSRVADHTVANEDLVNAPNWLPPTVRINDGPCFRRRPPSYRQKLDLRRGVRCADAAGRVTRMAQRRMVSMDDPHLAALDTTIVAENWNDRLEIRSALDGRSTLSSLVHAWLMACVDGEEAPGVPAQRH